jgi:hypothetical protein
MFSDNLTKEMDTTILSQTWNQDLWCITFQNYIPSYYRPRSEIWAHVYRRHPSDTTSFDLVFKVDMTKEHKSANSTFNQVHVCTTSSQALYHLITTNTKSALFNGRGYLITLGPDNTVTVDRFSKIQHPEQQWITRLLTYGPHVFLYYRVNNKQIHVISRGEIPLYSNKGILLKGRDKRIKYSTVYSFSDPEHIASPHVHGHVHIKGHIMRIETFTQASGIIHNVFNSQRTLDLVTCESTILNTYTRDLKYTPYPEYVAFDNVDNGYFILEHDYTINGIGIGSGSDAGHQYSEWLLTNYRPGDTYWVNPKLSYLKPDGSIVPVAILSAFIFDRLYHDHCLAVLSDSVVSIKYSNNIRPAQNAYTTIFYHFDRQQMALTPFTMTQYDSLGGTMQLVYNSNTNNDLIVVSNKSLAVLQPHVPNPSISALNEYLPVELVDIIHTYYDHTVPTVLYHNVTKID